MFEREENPQGVTKAKIVVGLASFMEADNIDYPTRQVDKGLLKHYPDEQAVIINADNASPDGTEDVFMGAEIKTPKIHIATPENTPGKGYNFLNMFRKVMELKADVLICIDSDLEEVDPIFPAQVRRYDHQQYLLSADIRIVRQEHPPAHRRRLRPVTAHD